MSCFDTVLVPCPSCGRQIEFQSKGGACNGDRYGLRTAPDDVLTDVNRHAPYNCKCGKLVSVQLRIIATPFTL